MKHVWFLILPRTLLCNTTYSCPLIHTDTDIRHHSSTSSMEVYNSHQHKTCLTHIILGPVFHSRAPVHQILPLLLWYKEELATQLVNMYFCELIFHLFIKEAVPSLSCLFFWLLLVSTGSRVLMMMIRLYSFFLSVSYRLFFVVNFF